MKNDMLINDRFRSYHELLAKILEPETKCMQPGNNIYWVALEDGYGFALPYSFKLVANHLPAGFLGSGITWMSPVADNPQFRFDPSASSRYHHLLMESGVLPHYPTLPGYLVFATTSLRIDLAFWVEPMDFKSTCCRLNVALIECISGEVEATDVEIDEFLYRAITHNPPLVGPLSARFHNWFFADMSFPLFSPYKQ